MLTYNRAFHILNEALQGIYDRQEATAIAQRYMEHLTGMTYTQRLIRREDEMPGAMLGQFETDKNLLATGKPLQQVVGYEWFLNRRFIVNEHVLIPRPETEELVEWIVMDNKDKKVLTVLDIGTGSGCIPVSVKLALPQSVVTGCDISEAALAVAKSNAENLDAQVQLVQVDFLDETVHNTLPQYDVVVSNPPYIPETETGSLHKNVREYEPHLALFVPGNDPLLFYRAIALFGMQHLQERGAVYCELHVDYALQTANMFEALGYTTTLRKDMNGNLRMLKAVK